MKINVTSPNPGLISIFKDPEQIITLDANYLIPPDRSRYVRRSFDFPLFQRIWLDPIFATFPKIAIHEAVYDELVLSSVQTYIQSMITDIPPRLIVHRDSVEARIFPLTNYEPMLDNREDRGEVKSLAYVAAKGLPYFAAHDSIAIQLVENAEKWSTGLDNVHAIKMYELIFYLCRKNAGNKKALRMLYKYQYYLTPNEKRMNAAWNQFIGGMDLLYPPETTKS
jgi:hypothetical protein